MRLAGKVALITGGAGGMGSAQARLFAQEGAAVCVADIHTGNGQRVVDEINAAGGRALNTPLDVTRAEQWAEAVAQAEAAFGSLTILCNNAGANFRVSFDDQTEEMWHLIMETALTGAFLGIKAAVPAMRRAGGGSIINIGSIATTRCGDNPGYAASKVGILGLTRAAARAYAKDNIRCNLVSPGHVDTPFIMWIRPLSAATSRTAPTTGAPASTTRRICSGGWPPRRWAAWCSRRRSPMPISSWRRTRQAW
ncbi:MAG: cyclopentanol dehydrogenase [Chloroflexi bacterium]|nr:MAG: cyclopentanol dehydrogenase [Chloroflexota bacterium]